LLETFHGNKLVADFKDGKQHGTGVLVTANGKFVKVHNPSCVLM
jgi:hypothetical protein